MLNVGGNAALFVAFFGALIISLEAGVARDARHSPTIRRVHPPWGTRIEARLPLTPSGLESR